MPMRSRSNQRSSGWPPCNKELEEALKFSHAYKKDPPKRVFRFRMVRARGLEPPWGCPHTDLNRTRLPIPPRPRIGALTRQEGMLRHFPVPRKSEFQNHLAPSCRTRKRASAERTAVHLSKTQKDPPKRVIRFRMVRARGLEPPWGCPHTDLNRTRLPIPPRPRIGA